MKKIFITRKIPDSGIKILKDKGYTVDIYPKDRIMSQKELIRTLKKGTYDAVVTLLTDKIDSTVFDAAPTVKLYANYATGFDNIDLTEAKKRGIAVTNAPAPQTSESVAEHALALALALAARIVEADEFMRKGKYKGWDPMLFIGMDILGKTLGIVGVGRIGGKVAHYASGLGLKVIYTDVARNEEIEKDSGAVFCSSVDELLPKADIVSIHVPLLDSTHHLINEARLRSMKPTAFLVNTSRGPVIDEVALTKALQEKTIAGAALDVFEFEPKIAPGLAKLPNVILTPHIASASLQTRDEMSEMAANNVADFFEGKPLRNNVIK
ncbi:MAG: D-glycerate dehydrogenase [Candidatus Pacebacteria bacterium]|nr:D-glycerate dehydrogenase [Candidatus Paceibacterota bacterium]